MNLITNWLLQGAFYGTLGSLAFTMLLLALLAVGIYMSNPYYSYVRWVLKSFSGLRLRRLA